MVVRCTARLLRLIGAPAKTLSSEAGSEEDWYANLVWLDGRKCLIAAHAGTLFPIFAPDVRTRDLNPLGGFLIARIRTALNEEGFADDALGPLDASGVELARTVSRSTLGFLNEIAFVCRQAVELAGRLELVDIDHLNHFLRRELHNRGGHYRRPIDLLFDRWTLQPSRQRSEPTS